MNEKKIKKKGRKFFYLKFFKKFDPYGGKTSFNIFTQLFFRRITIFKNLSYLQAFIYQILYKSYFFWEKLKKKQKKFFISNSLHIFTSSSESRTDFLLLSFKKTMF